MGPAVFQFTLMVSMATTAEMLTTSEASSVFTTGPQETENSSNTLAVDAASTDALPYSSAPDLQENGTNGPEKEENNRISIIGNNLFIYIAPPLAGLGFLGNMVAFAVMMSADMRSMSISAYLSALALADTNALLHLLATKWYNTLNGIDFLTAESHAFDCPKWVWRGVSFLLPACIVVCVSVERFIVTWFPFKGPHFCTRRTARIVIATLALLFLLISGSFVVWHYVKQGHCVTMNYVLYVYPALYSLLPVCLLVIFNSLPATKLLCRKPIGANALTTARITARKATKTILAVVGAYLALTFLGFLVIVIGATQRVRGTSLTGYEEFSASISFLGFMTNHSCNFILYVLTSTKFRGAFNSMFLAKLGCCFSAQKSDGNEPPMNVPDIRGTSAANKYELKENRAAGEGDGRKDNLHESR